MAPSWPMIVASAMLLQSADAHSALLANSKVLGQLNGGECFNCAIGSYGRPSDVPASAVDPSSNEDGIAAYLKTSGRTVKEVWQSFQKGTPDGGIAEESNIVAGTSPDTCGRFSADPPVDTIPSNAKITFKKSNHNGPAEVWIDGKKTYSVDNFITQGKATITPAVFACDKTECEGRWYWMGKVRVKGQWDHYQLYVQCFNIKGNGGNADAAPAGAASASSGNSTSTGKTTKATKAPKASSSSDTGADADATPVTKTPKSTKAPKTPKPSKTPKATSGSGDEYN
ncbi:hypothetical protein Gpo141_00014080 [Globisporangium polare]